MYILAPLFVIAVRTSKCIGNPFGRIKDNLVLGETERVSVVLLNPGLVQVQEDQSLAIVVRPRPRSGLEFYRHSLPRSSIHPGLYMPHAATAPQLYSLWKSAVDLNNIKVPNMCQFYVLLISIQHLESILCTRTLRWTSLPAVSI